MLCSTGWIDSTPTSSHTHTTKQTHFTSTLPLLLRIHLLRFVYYGLCFLHNSSLFFSTEFAVNRCICVFLFLFDFVGNSISLNTLTFSMHIKIIIIYNCDCSRMCCAWKKKQTIFPWLILTTNWNFFSARFMGAVCGRQATTWSTASTQLQ